MEDRSLPKEKRTGLIPAEEKKRICKPHIPNGFQPQPPTRPIRGRQRQEIPRRFDPVLLQRVYEPANYQNKTVDL